MTAHRYGRRTPRRDRERGAAAVEFALILPLLLLLVFGIIDFGRALNAQIVVSDAAGEGARANALGLPLTSSTPGAASITGRVNTAAATLGSVSVPASSATLCSATPAPAVGSVTVQYSFQYATPIGAIMKIFSQNLGSMTITAHGVMTCQN